ncbi:prolipoprotein diacylglyceryl transferase [Intrasporangium calvum]|uniref:Phosphatidylglycerol--prolipoprotein diacylglyceryl transferase n=1 Tax=Intrasporangium calvum TaxID=53358 RepID=A0ABT5GC72_9MICO|nr:prolipoprotein diacylglyceryl transferase [Intrasporangium calvum]MDC5695885.1 prolipoprotein diacylglyceryl transferase [Intrasporangium calvum]
MTQLSGIPLLLPAEIPSPTQSVWYLGPVPIRAYAMCILAGIVVAVWLTQRRLAARGAAPGVAIDISAWAVPFGIVGGRIYHVITDADKYFGPGRNPMDALKIYEGGLGIWGAIALGAVGAWIGCRQSGVDFRDFIDAAAPGVAIAQAMGRFGNWFNNELYGAETDVPWKLRIHVWDQAAGRAQLDLAGEPIVRGYFHPTFLYEALWVLVLAAFLIWLGRRFRLARGQVFAAYVMGYPVGRIVVENMRTDPATHILGQRVNTWTSILVFLLGAWLWWWFDKRAGARDEPADADGGSATATDTATDTEPVASPDGAAEGEAASGSEAGTGPPDRSPA